MQDAHFSSLAPDLASGAIELEDVDLASTSILDRSGSSRRAPSRANAACSRAADIAARVAIPDAIADYEIVRLLGRGGMGAVYMARHPATGETIALKTANPLFPDAAASLRREIGTLERVSHRGVVRVHANGKWKGAPFYTMDLVSGPHLGQLSSRFARARSTTRVSVRLLTILRRIASSLIHLHAAHIAHGDLSPSNILIRRGDEPVLVDFGLSASFALRTSHHRRPWRERAIGTLAYMAPEQIRNEPIDGRTDFYAWGCLLYEALTGRPPFIGRHRGTVLHQHLEAAPCPPSLHVKEIPAALDELTLGLLAKAPGQRDVYAARSGTVLGSFGAEDWANERRTAPRRLVRTDATKTERRRSEEEAAFDA